MRNFCNDKKSEPCVEEICQNTLQLRGTQGRAVSTQKRRAELDKYDVAILSALATNTRLSTVELAAIVHLSRTAVSRRISNLKRTHVLNDAAEVLNYESLGFAVRAVVEISAPSHTAEVLRKKLLQEPEILTISVIAGDGLLCLDVIAVDMDHLHHFINSLQKSGDTTTKIVFAAEKSQLTLIERMHKLKANGSSNLVKG